MVTRFVPKGEKELSSSHILDYQRFFLGDTRKSNIINGKLIDFGAVYLNYSSKEEEQIAKKILPLIKKGDLKKIKEMLDKNKHSVKIRDFIANYLGNSNLYRSNGERFTPEQITALKFLEQYDFSI